MLKKLLKISLVILIAGFVIVQAFRIDKTNPPIIEAETIEAAVSVPPDISQILVRSCNDCHSHKSIYPWYANIQPSGWFLRNHIDHAREHLNFSVFNTYSARKKAHKFEEICEQLQLRAMPLPSYLWLHRDAVLSESDAKVLCNWANQEKGKISL